jgi:hypothetical protein
LNKTLAFLESLGRDARLARASGSELGSAAREAGVEPQLVDALARRDHVLFRRLLSALVLGAGLTLPPPGYAFVFSPSEEESAPEPEQESPSSPEESAEPAAPPAEPAPTIEPVAPSEPAADGGIDVAPEGEEEADAGDGSGEDPALPDSNEPAPESADEGFDEAGGEAEEQTDADETGDEDDTSEDWEDGDDVTSR